MNTSKYGGLAGGWRGAERREAGAHHDGPDVGTGQDEVIQRVCEARTGASSQSGRKVQQSDRASDGHSHPAVASPIHALSVTAAKRDDIRREPGALSTDM